MHTNKPALSVVWDAEKAQFSYFTRWGKSYCTDLDQARKYADAYGHDGIKIDKGETR